MKSTDLAGEMNKPFKLKNRFEKQIISIIMERKTFTVAINASKEKIWDILWNDSSYRAWTSVFMEGSRAETDWKKGSKALFTDGKGNGMVSTIIENIPNEFMSIKHLGEVKNGVEDTDSEKVKQWAGSMENYTLKNINGQTELTLEMDIAEEYMD